MFNTVDFLVLFILFFAGYVMLIKRFNLRILYTLLFSLYFYYQSSGWYFFLLIGSTLVDFGLGHAIYSAPQKWKKRLILLLSLVVNLGLLGYFKYTNFFLGALNEMMGTNFALRAIFLPVGISFFTFQTLSYSIDIYRGKLVPLTAEVHSWSSFWARLLDFAFFVSFFPQLVAGPIVRAADFIPQIRKKPMLSRAAISKGFLLIMGGVIKKAVISDYISVNFVDRVFESPFLYSGAENLLAAYGYAIQIYCDFSGYSDIAIGLALLLGFVLPENFRHPYRAFSLQDFWRRWHISLSTWLRDYLYISLGGNRKGKIRTYVNLMITMLLGGLWHGASWVFIIWGGLHGIGLALERTVAGGQDPHRKKSLFWQNPASSALFLLSVVHLVGFILIIYRGQVGLVDADLMQNLLWGNTLIWLTWILLWLIGWLIDLTRYQLVRYPFSRVVSTLFIFHFVTFCWVFFRAGAIGASLAPLEATEAILSQILGGFDWTLTTQIWRAYHTVIMVIVLGFLLHYVPQRLRTKAEQWFAQSPVIIQSLMLAIVIWIVIQTASADVVPFIYFQF